LLADLFINTHAIIISSQSLVSKVYLTIRGSWNC